MRKRRGLIALMLGVAASIFAVAETRLAFGQGVTGAVVEFTEAEIATIVSHGPWPAAWKPDPSNRASGNGTAIYLGERLFFDKRLSADGSLSCGQCHLPDLRWTDGRAQALGRQRLDRNTPHLNNVRLNRWYGWDGGNDSLWSQSIQPILDPRELGANPKHVVDLLERDADLKCRYEKTFAKPPSASDEQEVLANVGKALAAFQETLGSGRTAFDEFRDALSRGDQAVAMRYSAAAQRGLKIFVGKGRCSTCHTGPAFTNGEFHAIGVSFFAVPGRVDPGRYEGIKKLQANPFNLLGRFNDDLRRSTAISTRHVAGEQRNFGEFRTPSLRNVSITSPYMHDGQHKTLRDVLKHYSELNPDRLHADGESLLKPLRLSAQETNDLLVFLETLSNHADNWWHTPEHIAPKCQ